MTAYLVGGGGGDVIAGMFGSFLAECSGSGSPPRIATVLIDEGSGAAEFSRFAGLLTGAGECVPVPVLIPIGETMDPSVLDDADGMLVCGGLTPEYAAGLAPAATNIRSWLDAGRPYAGFSAGSAIAAGRAIVGGWLLDGVPICHEDSAEELDDLTIVDGLGLVPFAVDVHCAQWGTLSRVIAAVETGRVAIGVGIDEDTMLTASGDELTVSGRGRVWVATPGNDDVAVLALHDGATVGLSDLMS